MPSNDSSSSIATAPVSASSPVGAPLRDDEDFDRVQAELRKLDSLTDEATDWRQVIDGSERILREKSKDLRVACYACIGRFMVDGYAGLAQGLDLLGGTISAFWRDLYPPLARIGRRLKVLEWTGDRLLAAVEERAASPADREALAACLEGARGLERLVREGLAHVDEDQRVPDPGGKLLRLISAIERRQSAAAPRRSPASTTGNGTKPARPSDTPKTADEARTAFTGLKDDLLLIARLIQSANASDAWSYRLRRTVLWSRAAVLTADADGSTRLPGPDSASAAAILEKLSAQAAPEGLREVEQLIEKHPFWLDLHHLSWTFLGSLGSESSRAADAIQHELLGLVRENPDLPRWSFRSAVPLASAATRAWIEQGGQAPAASAAPGHDTCPAGDDAHQPEAVAAAARKLAAARNLPGAIRLFQDAIAACGDRRQQFDLRLHLARFASEQRQPPVALAQLEILDEEAARFRLAEWDPPLYAEALVQQIRVLQLLARHAGTKQRDDRLDEYRRRLCRVVPARALELEPR